LLQFLNWTLSAFSVSQLCLLGRILTRRLRSAIWGSPVVVAEEVVALNACAELLATLAHRFVWAAACTGMARHHCSPPQPLGVFASVVQAAEQKTHHFWSDWGDDPNVAAMWTFGGPFEYPGPQSAAATRGEDCLPSHLHEYLAFASRYH
jgi:hypothetical protein